MMKQVQHDNLGVRKVRDKFSEFNVEESRPLPGLRPEEGAPRGQSMLIRCNLEQSSNGLQVGIVLKMVLWNAVELSTEWYKGSKILPFGPPSHTWRGLG